MPHIDAKKPPKAARQTGGEREVSVRYAQEFNPGLFFKLCVKSKIRYKKAT